MEQHVLTSQHHRSPPTAPCVEQVIRATAQLPPRAIEWVLEDTTLVLRGTVTSFYQKQLAQSAVGKLPGIERVVNEIIVESCVSRCGRFGHHDQ